MTKYNRNTLLMAVGAGVAALLLAHAPDAKADQNNGPNNPSPGVLYPMGGNKICANHSMYPIPGQKQIYKAACAVGTWGAPDPVTP